VSRIALVVFFAALSVAGCSSAPRAASPAAEIDTIQSTREAGVDKISQSQLQAMVMSMADSYLLAVGEAFTLMELDAETPLDRWTAHDLKRTTGAAVLGVAAGPSPEAALLDLLVLSSLEVEAIRNRIEHPKASDLMREHGPALLEQDAGGLTGRSYTVPFIMHAFHFHGLIHVCLFSRLLPIPFCQVVFNPDRMGSSLENEA